MTLSVCALVCLLVAGQVTYASKEDPKKIKTTKKGLLITERDTVSGEMSLNLKKDQLVAKINPNRHQVWTAQGVKKVDVNGQIYQGAEYQGRFYFFEVLFAGDKTILFRDDLVGTMELEEEPIPGFFTFQAGKLVPVFKSKEILQAFEGDLKWMKQYIKHNSIDLKR